MKRIWRNKPHIYPVGEERPDEQERSSRMQTLLQWTALPTAACVLLLAVISVLQIDLRGKQSVAKPDMGYILIDPGHGGFDGGAVAPDGTQEKDINLSISLGLRDMLTILGYDVRMTRQEDTALNQGGSSIREKKVEDMKKRLALYEQAALVIGIHQNKFEIPKYNGTQIFYSPNKQESKLLADCIRTQVISMLQPENSRELKKAGDTVYLLNKTTVPAVFVECGFLSNPEELERLKNEDYQKQMAFAVACGYMEYAA